MFCGECGTQLVSDARFCLNCGKALDELMLKELEEENRAKLVGDSNKTVIPAYSFDDEKASKANEEKVALAEVEESFEVEESTEVEDRSAVMEVEKNAIQEEVIAEKLSVTGEPSIEQTAGTIIAPTAKNTFDEESVDKILSIISEGNSATAIGFNAINRKLDMILELLKKQEERQAAAEEQISEVKKTIKGIKITFEE